MKGAAKRVVRGVRPLRHRRRRSFAPILFLAPAAVLFVLFVLYPVAASLRLSLFEWHGIGPKTWVGLGNFRALLADPVFNTAFRNNLIWLALIPAAPAMGLAIALLLDRASARMRLVRICFFLPFVMSQVVIGIVFAWFFHPDLGLLNQVLARLGGPTVAPLESEFGAIFAVIVAHLWPQTAFCMIIYLAGLAILNPALEGAAPAGWCARLADSAARHPAAALACALHRGDGVRGQRAAQLRSCRDNDTRRALRQLQRLSVLHVSSRPSSACGMATLLRSPASCSRSPHAAFHFFCGECCERKNERGLCCTAATSRERGAQPGYYRPLEPVAVAPPWSCPHVHAFDRGSAPRQLLGLAQ